MTEDTLKVYGPCDQHQLWHDLETECFECMCDRVKAETPQPADVSCFDTWGMIFNTSELSRRPQDWFA